MNKTGMTDPGHGDFDPGAMGNGLRECDLTWKFGTKFSAIMERCGVKIYFTREQNKTATNNKNAELAYRCKLANQKGVSFYISFHINAGGGTGFESFRYLTNDSATVRLQQLIHKRVAPIFTAHGMPDRGMKQADFAVLRGTNMPAVLMELGFIDNARDAKYINTDDFQNKVAEAVARAVCEWMGIAYVSESTVPPIKEIPATLNGKVVKAIIVGGNTHLSKSVIDLLNISQEQAKAINSLTYKGETYFVWNRIPGMKDANQRKDEGFDFVATVQPKKETKPEPIGTPIMGESVAVRGQLLMYAKSLNKDFPVELPGLYLNIGKRYGIRGDIAFAQMLKETGFFKFGGDVKREQNNFAGLGATGGVEGASFSSLEDGVRAHIQHLYAYCSTKDVPAGEKVVDPRFGLVTRGSVTTWEGLNGKWAVPGDGYGESILAVHQKVLEFKPEPQPDLIDKLVTHGIVETPEYWRGLIAGDKAFVPAYFVTLISRVVEKLEGK